jgi:hypothetical protein
MSNNTHDQYQRDLEYYGNFREEDWKADKQQFYKHFDQYKKNTELNTEHHEPIFNFRINLIDYLRPFVNKRGVRSKFFRGDQYEVKIVQLETIPGSAKLIYRDLDMYESAIEPIYINSVETAEKDMAKAAKKLYKKAKKL